MEGAAQAKDMDPGSGAGVTYSGADVIYSGAGVIYSGAGVTNHL